mmetsp:Transcript_33893/g.71134  ORF Transcript_33893/g.71134 Transcript_33893/m.71134 type:complete len:338 (-) Transcript_33893:47-1060(-)
MTQRALGHNRPGHVGQNLEYADTAAAYEPSDVPLKAVIAKKQIQHFLDADHLGLKKQPWNNLTKPDGPFPGDHGPWHDGMPFSTKFPDRNLKRTLSIGTSIKAEIDFRAERLPKRDPVMPTKTSKLQFDPRKILGDKVPANLGGTGKPQERMDTTVPPGKEGAKQTRFVVDVDATGALDMKEPWNGSTVMDRHWKLTNHNHLLERALCNSDRAGARLARGRTGLVAAYNQTLAAQRQGKKIASLLQGDFDDVLAAAELQKGQAESLALEETRRAEMDRMDVVFSKGWKDREYFCDGVWGLDPLEGRWCWSCCGSTSRDGPGCCPKKKAGRWNFASIN